MDMVGLVIGIAGVVLWLWLIHKAFKRDERLERIARRERGGRR